MANFIIALLTALIGGLIGTYFGARFLNMREENKMQRVRDIAIKALNVIKKYAKQSYRNAENDFNTSLSITEKRMVIVALHKLGVPIGVPSNEVFNIRKVFFVNTIIEEDEINGIILQINKGFCDNLFYIDPDTYFAANYTQFAMRNAGKKYVSEVLAKSRVNVATNQLIEPIDLGTIFSLGEFKAIQVLRDQVRDQMYFDKNGLPIKERIESLLKDIDLGLWDMYLMWNFEAYQNVKAQNQMGQFISNLPRIGTPPMSNSSEAKSLLDKQCDKKNNKKLQKNKNKVY
jgi:hypothetical protein